MNPELTADQLAALLENIKPRRSEVELQDAIGTKLSAHAVTFKREHKLDRKNRLDFYVETSGHRVAIETKVSRASGPDTERQLLRYALTGKIDAILLVCTRGFPFDLDVIKCGERFIPVKVINLEMNFL